jgi:uncharacterized membrane protein YdjX (TVP38/TMEM64 family)
MQPIDAREAAAANDPKGAPATRWVRWLPLAIMAAVLLLGLVSGVQKLVHLETVIDARDRYRAAIADHRIGALALYLLVYVTVVATSLPGATILTLAGGLMFGWLVGSIATVAAATTGASLVFLVARTTVGESLARRAGPQVARLQAGFCENALSYLLFLRLVPAFPFFVVNIVPALIGVPFRTYVIGTALGIMPGSLAYSFIGAGLDGVVAMSKAEQAACLKAKIAAECPLKLDLAALLSMEFKVAIGLLGVLALAPVVIKLWRQRHARAHA